MGRPPAAADDDAGGADLVRAPIPPDLQRVVVDKRGCSRQELDLVPIQQTPRRLALAGHGLADAEDQVVPADMLLDGVVLPIESSLPKPGEVEDRLPQGLAGDPSRLYTRAPEIRVPVHHRDPLAQACCGDRRSHTAGTAAYDDEVVVFSHVVIIQEDSP